MPLRRSNRTSASGALAVIAGSVAGSALMTDSWIQQPAPASAYSRRISAQLDVEPMTVLVDRPSSRRPARVPLGFAVVALALVSVLISSAVFHPGIVGEAAVDPRQFPPPPGSCVLLDLSTPVVIDCARPHHAEITASWWADAPGAPVIDPTRPAAPINGSDCYRESAVALGLDSTAGPWLPIEPVVTARVVQSGPNETGQGWTACLVAAPDGRLFTGSIRSPAQSAWPDVFARCVATDPELVVVTCSDPHDVEVFGRFNATSRYGSPLPRPDPRVLLQECTDLVRERVGATDPTLGGVVTVRAQPLLPGWRYDVVESDAGGRPTVTSHPTPFCFVETVTGQLTATLIARGLRPAPIR